MAAAAILLASWLEIGLALSSGPPNEVTDAPPAESTCATVGCHSSFALNSGSGAFTISTPSTYLGGDTLDVTVNISQSGQQRWGFELTVLNSSGQPVGDLIITNSARNSISTAGNGRQYVKHTSAGTDAGTANASPGWAFRWASPATGDGTITFYAAGNAADNNGTAANDYIYTSTTTVTQLATSIDDQGAVTPIAMSLPQNYPNPFNPSTTINFQIGREAAGAVELVILNTLGQRVRSVISREFLQPGHYTRVWDGKNDAGIDVASGVYFYQLRTAVGAQSREMTLLR